MRAYFEALAGEYPLLALARVISQDKGLYKIACGDTEERAEVSGKFRYDAMCASDYPTVGDYVMVSRGGGRAIIHKLLPRRSVFIRRAAGTAEQEQLVAANIDIVFLCMALNNDFNLRRLERYLSLAWDSGARPIVLLTKADLCKDIQSKIAEVERIALGVDVIVTSSTKEDGIAAVLPHLKRGVTASFIGSSGVGKSTLINRLMGEKHFATNGLRDDDKGRHTTTHRELIELESGAMLIDTPGMRELGMWGAEHGIDAVFAEIDALSASCKYKNCTHTSEPGCAVIAAMQRGELDEERLASYKKLNAENAYAENSASYLASKEKKFKQIAIFNKANQKRR